jgi:hypothetical protein
VESARHAGNDDRCGKVVSTGICNRSLQDQGDTSIYQRRFAVVAEALKVVAEIYIELLAVATDMLRVHQRSNIAAQVIEGVRRTGKKVSSKEMNLALIRASLCG